MHELVNCSAKSVITKAVDDRVDSEHSQTASMLLEMLLVRDGLLYQSALARVELEDMIYEIAVGRDHMPHILFVCTALCTLSIDAPYALRVRTYRPNK